jgi:hypothetical protein
MMLLNDKILEPSSAEPHIGIMRTAKGSNIETVIHRIRKARQTSYSLMGAGMHGLNGTGPSVALTQYRTYVLPTLLYGMEALVLSDSEISQLELYHRKNLRMIQHLPQSTASCALLLLTGQTPIEAQIHIKVLSLYRNVVDPEVANAPSLYTRSLIMRQLGMKEDNAPSWVAYVRRLLRQYDLPNCYTLLEDPPRKQQWKKQLKEAVFKYWANLLRDEAHSMSTLRLLNKNAYQQGRLHPVWQGVSSQLDIKPNSS